MQELIAESEYANRFHIISRMADDLAHEIKNPLNSMVINIEVLRSRAKKGDVDGVMDRAAVLETEVRRLNTLIDGLLKLLRPEKTSGESFYVDTLLDEIGDLVGIQARLARRSFASSGIGQATAGRARRTAVRFALLNILGAELDAVASEDGGVSLGGTSDGTMVTVRIEASGTKEADAGDARDGALAFARSLMEREGGAVALEPAGGSGDSRVILVQIPQAQSA